MRLTLLPAALLLGAAFAAPLAGQRAGGLPIELGVDASITRDDRADVTTLLVPVSRLRVGFFLSPTLSLEPTLFATRTSSDGGSSSLVSAGLGLLAHVGGVPVGRARTPSVFVRPFAGFSRSGFRNDNGGSGSRTQANFGGGLGVKFPVADRLAWRLEGVYTRFAESDDNIPGRNTFGLNFGLSFHTR